MDSSIPRRKGQKADGGDWLEASPGAEREVVRCSGDAKSAVAAWPIGLSTMNKTWSMPLATCCSAACKNDMKVEPAAVRSSCSRYGICFTKLKAIRLRMRNIADNNSANSSGHKASMRHKNNSTKGLASQEQTLSTKHNKALSKPLHTK
eukprot:TRINITY_DN12068_c0_g2_i2.p1 TRINITY_DN12068_c0_g2~~TRINITY_DN12068_c0_g2_i2.p1  ORF type:complete len:149 (-),score=14.97 TRINITY_DN12068_c0_g2_i2:1239-1685(-)